MGRKLSEDDLGRAYQIGRAGGLDYGAWIVLEEAKAHFAVNDDNIANLLRRIYELLASQAESERPKK